MNWNRWIFVSASTYFKNKINLVDPTIKVQIEGQNYDEKGEYIEFRLVGPIWTRLSPTTYRGEWIINLLVRVMKSNQTHNIYKQVGIVESTFNCFPIKKYGNGVDDNSSITIGTAFLDLKDGKEITTTHFGQIAPDLPVIQSTVEGKYFCELVG